MRGLWDSLSPWEQRAAVACFAAAAVFEIDQVMYAVLAVTSFCLVMLRPMALALEHAHADDAFEQPKAIGMWAGASIALLLPVSVAFDREGMAVSIVLAVAAAAAAVAGARCGHVFVSSWRTGRVDPARLVIDWVRPWAALAKVSRMEGTLAAGACLWVFRTPPALGVPAVLLAGGLATMFAIVLSWSGASMRHAEDGPSLQVNIEDRALRFAMLSVTAAFASFRSEGKWFLAALSAALLVPPVLHVTSKAISKFVSRPDSR